MQLTEEQLNKKVTMEHLRAARYCAPGSRRFIRDYKGQLDTTLSKFCREGITVRELVALNDGRADKLIKLVLKD